MEALPLRDWEGGDVLSPGSEARLRAVIRASGDSAPGPDGLPYEVYRAFEDEAVWVLQPLVLAALGGGDLPEDFN